MLAAHFSSPHLHPAHVSEHNNYYKNNYVYMYMLSIHILYGHIVHYSTHLMNSIQELQKDWAEVMFQSCPVCLVTSFGEGMPKGKPVLLHHHTKSLLSLPECGSEGPATATPGKWGGMVSGKCMYILVEVVQPTTHATLFS